MLGFRNLQENSKNIFFSKYLIQIFQKTFQIYHYCHADGKQDTFHCGYGTIFNEYLGTCDHSGAVYCKGGEGYAGPPAHPAHPVHPDPGYHNPEPSYHTQGESELKKQHGKKTTSQPTTNKKTTVHNNNKKPNKTEDLMISTSDPLKNNQNFHLDQKSQDQNLSLEQQQQNNGFQKTGFQKTLSSSSEKGFQNQNSLSQNNHNPNQSKSQNSLQQQKQQNTNSSQNIPKYKFLIPNPSNWLREMREIRDNVPPKVKHKIAYSKIVPPSSKVICDITKPTMTKMQRFKNIMEHNSQQFAGRCFCCFLTVSILFYPVVFITLMFMYHPFHE